MDFLVLWIGYTILTAGGVVVTLALCGLVAEAVWRSLRGALNLADLREAVDEWKTNHPERYAAWQKRNEGRE